MNILIIDDSREHLEASTYLLEKHGYHVQTVSDPQYAPEMIRRQNPNLIVLDIMMPALDGFSLLKNVKEQENTKNIPVIILTGKVFPPDKKKAIALGADEFISKPVNGNLFLQTIQKYMEA